MTGLLTAAATALWLGILTSISPCPLATNIAAISFLGKRISSPRGVLSAGLLYSAGRVLAYVILAVLLVKSALSAPQVSQFLQTYMNRALGPVLILVGMVLLDLIHFDLPELSAGAKLRERLAGMGMWGALPMGSLFALSLCPVSAALFFGSLIPIAIRTGSGILIPSVYGIGTGLPVLVFAALIAFGLGSVGRAYDRLAVFEKWARRVTGVVFILVGIYYCLAYIFEVFK